MSDALPDLCDFCGDVSEDSATCRRCVMDVDLVTEAMEDR